MRKSIILQLVSLLFVFIPLSRCYRLKAVLLRFAGIDCDKSARIISSARLISSNIIIGNDTFVGHQVLITGSSDAKIIIGNHVDIAPRVVILSGSHIIDMKNEHSAGLGIGKNVTIGNGVWIGANSTILPGVTIGEKSVIGAGSVVVNDIPPMCIAVGNPCRPIKIWSYAEGRFKSFQAR